jgi:hypothetical protein
MKSRTLEGYLGVRIHCDSEKRNFAPSVQNLGRVPSLPPRIQSRKVQPRRFEASRENEIPGVKIWTISYNMPKTDDVCLRCEVKGGALVLHSHHVRDSEQGTD